MSVYLDASVLVSLFVDDAHTPIALTLENRGDVLTVSTWTLTETTSALNKIVRLGRLDTNEATELESSIDAWAATAGGGVPLLSGDVMTARRLLRRPSAGPLRAGDALHLATAMRLGLTLATFDSTLADASSAFGHPVWPERAGA